MTLYKSRLDGYSFFNIILKNKIMKKSEKKNKDRRFVYCNPLARRLTIDDLNDYRTDTSNKMVEQYLR